MAPALLVDALTKRYAGRTVVDAVSFTIEPGEVVSLLGPNGAGKTTLLEMIGGFRKPDSGTARVLGFDPGARGTAAQMRDRIGFVAQATATEPTATPRELLTMYSRYYSNPIPVAELLELTELEESADKRMVKLSGGQQRRVDVALGVIGRPELAFLDEPSVGLDAASKRGLWGLIDRLAATGTTIVLTTHAMEEAQALSTRVLVMRGGRLIADASPDALRNELRTHTTISFLCDVDPRTSGLPLESAAGQWRLLSATPTEDLTQLLAWAARQAVELRLLTVKPPSLEDAYLELVGQGDVMEVLA